jgi:hypothetical protein
MRIELLAAALALAACGGTASTDAAAAPVDGAGADTGLPSYCNVQQQTSCSQGDRCTKLHLASGGLSTPVCLSDPGSVPLGGACTITAMIDDCLGGGVCLDGVCHQACDGGGCPVGFCGYPNNVCWAACDPLAPTCASGEACYPPYANYDGPGCAPSGSLALGAKCQEPNDCAPGSTCAVEGGGRCTRVCRIGGGAPACTGTDRCAPRHATDMFGVCVAAH